MTIQAILKNKGAEVVAIDATHQVAEAVRIMDKRQIGALVVTGQGEDCSGIFTERDVMRALARNGTHILDDAVGQHMTDRPQSILPTTSVEQAMEIMTERRFRHLPVMTGTTLCGIVSIGDLVNYRINQSEMEATALKEYIATG
ncbi:MAG: CBS domain-containing protein [Parvibaculales bacterium]|jgi:CBS domain-containing protein|tara:strand:+ start:483 stop:914 length:432 start_codon:yes stop_codon:yes gene_type:complete